MESTVSMPLYEYNDLVKKANDKAIWVLYPYSDFQIGYEGDNPVLHEVVNEIIKRVDVLKEKESYKDETIKNQEQEIEQLKLKLSDKRDFWGRLFNL